ncbi:MAG: U32 family peptidase [Peptostreptococcaceae bacterium]|nr:U32 family peptidase [Peptostreptococcaceae bacterium]
MTKKVELLAPAGDLEKLKTAIIYGADAVYIGGESFGMRTASKNFTFEEMKEGIRFCHERNKKLYVTLNIIPHNDDFEGLKEYLLFLDEIDVDAVIVADPGVLMMVKEHIPNMEIHLSTQANNTNFYSARFWYDQGIRRIVTARELSFDEIRRFRDSIPEDMEIESFVHGAMCISYSGRCLMSNYMTGRDANRGACAHPCRWKYSLVEEKRPGEYFPIEEDESGTYIFNSKDLCLIDSIREIVESGIDSLKIEGRVKTAYYVATIVRAYRIAIDSYYEDPANYKFDPDLLEEVKKASYRDFTHGFYKDKPSSDSQNYGSGSYIRNYDFIGVVTKQEKNMVQVEIRNRVFVNDEIEIIGPGTRETIYTTVKRMYSENMEPIEVAPRPKELVWMDLDVLPNKDFIIRKRSEKENVVC